VSVGELRLSKDFPMSSKPKRSPVYTQDRDGKAIVLVPLANHAQPAKLFPEDLELLSSSGLGMAWTFNPAGNGTPYVRAYANVHGKLVTVARLILGVGRGRRVQYRDGDRLNLRRDNLVATQGYAKGKTVIPCPTENRCEDFGQLSEVAPMHGYPCRSQPDFNADDLCR